MCLNVLKLPAAFKRITNEKYDGAVNIGGTSLAMELFYQHISYTQCMYSVYQSTVSLDSMMKIVDKSSPRLKSDNHFSFFFFTKKNLKHFNISRYYSVSYSALPRFLHISGALNEYLSKSRPHRILSPGSGLAKNLPRIDCNQSVCRSGLSFPGGEVGFRLERTCLASFVKFMIPRFHATRKETISSARSSSFFFLKQFPW